MIVVCAIHQSNRMDRREVFELPVGKTPLPKDYTCTPHFGNYGPTTVLADDYQHAVTDR